MDFISLIITFIAGFLAVFIGVITGGGGLLTLPVLIFIGLPPHTAIATNRLGTLGGFGSSIVKFRKKGKIDLSIGLPTAVFTVLGGAIGARMVIDIPAELLQKGIGLFILIIGIISYVNKKKPANYITKNKQKEKFSKNIGIVLFFFIGLFSSMLGGGFGILSSYVLMYFFSQTFLESAGTRKIAGVAMSIIATIIFATQGLINWLVGCVLFVGMGLGGYFGSHYGIKKGEEWAKNVFLVVVALFSLKLLFF